MSAAVLWIIGASVGEYSDRSEWSVCVFEVEADAKAHCDRLNALSRETADQLRRWRDSGAYMEAEWEAEQRTEAQITAAMKELDGGWDVYAGQGATYHCGEVPYFPQGTLPASEDGSQGT